MPEMGDYLKYVAGGFAASAGALAWWLASSEPAGTKYVVSSSLEQSKELDVATRTSLLVDGSELVEKYFDDVGTAYQAFQRGARVSNNGPCLGWRSTPEKGYDSWLSYDEVRNKAVHVGSGLVQTGLPADNSSFVGVYATNCPEYTILQQACFMYSMVVVPLYDTLGTLAIVHIANQSHLKVIICDEQKCVQTLLGVADQLHFVETLIMVKEPEASFKSKVEAKGWKLITYKQLEVIGQDAKQEIKPAQPDELLMIGYTSGTTGYPKGAMLTHRNVLSGVAAMLKFLTANDFHLVDGQEVHLSYLPMAHAYEQFMQMLVFTVGGRVGFSQGNVRLLMDDLACLKPTLFPTVPRLLNRMYDKVMSAVKVSRIKSLLFNLAMKSKANYLSRGILTQNTIWDRLVFKKLQQSLGGRVRVIISASAPVSEEILLFLRCAFGVTVLEAYGQTECSAVTSITLPGTIVGGHVGPPLPCNHIKLIDVPEMNYFARDNKGEVCMKGPNVFKGYLHDAEKTTEALDVDGWLRTGDIGQWLPDGTLKIIDRRKNIFKLAQGEYIAPEKIESVYMRSSLVAQVFVHGDSLKANLVAIVVPDVEVLLPWAANNLAAAAASFSELCKHKKVKDAIKLSMDDLAKEAGLKSFEQVKDIYLHDELFSVANGLLTPTFKLRRIEARLIFADKIEEMYKTLE